MSSTHGDEFYDDDEDEIVLETHLEDNDVSDLDSTRSEDLKFTPTCSICYRKFNTTSRVPMIISKCGPSVCDECINKIDSCPICRIEIQETVINWAIHSELKSYNYNKIDPFYKIFIDYKEDIELDYLKNPDTLKYTCYEDLSCDQKKLINKIKFRIKDIELKDYMFENLLIPLWIKHHIKLAKGNIAGYKAKLIYFGIDNLEDQLPFCP